MCKAYVEQLGQIPKSALDAAGTRIVVIGCGDWSVINMYKGELYRPSVSTALTLLIETSNNYPYEVYAEPTRELHRTLGLGSNMKGPSADEPRKSYNPGVFRTVVTSLIVRASLTRVDHNQPHAL